MPRESIPYVGLTHEQKVSRLENDTLSATTTAANIFSADVARGKKRYLVGLLISNQDAAPIDIDVNTVDVDNNSDELFDQLVIDAEGNFSAQGQKLVDVDTPFHVLTGGQNLEFDVVTVGKTAEVTLWWYDDPRVGA